MVAAQSGHMEVMEVLLDRGADVNAQNETGQTALIGAASLGDAELVNFLLDRGADPNITNKESGFTALIAATWSDYPEIVETLLRKGAQVNAKDKFGKTPLKWAREKGHTQIIQLLQSAGGTE